MGLLAATCLVVANMVGTGIFTSLGFQVASLPSVSVLLFLWLLGGVIALCGGLSYIELAKQMPGSGGEYHYISKGYPAIFSWLAALVSVFAGFAAPTALACMAFAAYLQPALGVSKMALAISILTVVTLFHAISLKLGSSFQVVFTILKLLALLILIYFGLSDSRVANPISFTITDLNLISSKSFAISLVYISFAYSGWNACVYIFQEIDDAGKNIKQAVIIGVILVTILYLLVTWVFLKIVPFSDLDGVIEVGHLVSQRLFGSDIGSFMSSLMGILLVSSISAMVWISPRVIAKLADDKGIKQFASLKNGVPLNAIVLQYIIVVLIIFTDSFEKILTYSALLMNFCALLSVALLLRTKKPKATIILAGIFCLVTIWSCYHILSDLNK